MASELVKSRENRGVLRSSYTKVSRELEELLRSNPDRLQDIRVSFEMLATKFEQIVQMDTEVYELMLDKATEEELVEEIDGCDIYRKKYINLKFRCEQAAVERDEVGSRVTSIDTQTGKRKFRLPVIEFKRYDGSIKDWLSFWAQFKNVDEDSEIDESDKIEYLIQATVAGSRARRLVESFPPMRENYPKIIQVMKDRFGREDLQIEVYVRELLKLVLGNVISQRVDLCSLYDMLETQLRALETLGVTSDKFSAMLFPLIESAIPQDLLRVWQRSSVAKVDSSDLLESDAPKTLESRLQDLMRFLRNEVDGEQRISLAAESFGFKSTETKAQELNKVRRPTAAVTLPTAMGLVNNEVKCLFCNGNHASDVCFKARELTLEEKKKRVTEKKSLFRCLKVGHQVKRCYSRLRCLICMQSHVLLLCPNLKAYKRADAAQVVGQEEPVLNNRSSSHVFLQTLRVKIVGIKSTRTVRALIDSDSSRTYILKSTAEKLGCSLKYKEKLLYCLFGGQETENVHSCYEIAVSYGKQLCKMEALDQVVICHDVSPFFGGPWTEELRNLGITLDDTGTGPIELLLGADVFSKIYTGRMQILQCGLVAIETRLGWTIMGKVPSMGVRKTDAAVTTLNLMVRDTTVPSIWELDVLGITETSEKENRAEMAAAAKELFLETVTVNQEDRYEVRLPWYEDHPSLPINYNLAKNRLESTLRKLKKDNLLQPYDQVFQEWLEEGIIEVVKCDEVHLDCHYLPHRPVVKQNSATTKIRPVFDASAQDRDGPSLNQCLEKGPNLIEQIPSVLIRFREKKLGVVADIRKAFLQISMHPKDRNFLRFLWIGSDENVKVYRHRRVVFGVNSSPFLLGATIDYYLQNCSDVVKKGVTYYSQNTIETLKKSFYVDNCVTSVSDYVELNQFMQEAKGVVEKANFDLRGWEYSTEDNSQDVPVLGLKWYPKKDTLAINLDICDNMDRKVTKRSILSMTQRIFDPIGFTSPVTLVPKLLLQQLWEKKLSWDQAVDEETNKAFADWMEQLQILTDIEIPRWVNIKLRSDQCSSLHIFPDASKKAFACAIFLRTETDNGIAVSLLAAKARVAPLRKTTIPRLELLAATIGARLYATVKENLSCEFKTFFWSDSSTVISWIQRKEEWSAFVFNRVREIRILTSPHDWRHVPGSLNPADLASRGCSPKRLVEMKWWEGPNWLYNDQSSWPHEPYECDENEILKERKKLREAESEHVPDLDAVDRDSYNKKLQYIQKLRDDLRKRFRSEYLGQIKLFRAKKNSHREVKINEIVLIGNEQSKRLDWPLGRVIKILKGKDGEIRLVRLRTLKGQLLRPVQRLYPLEVVDVLPQKKLVREPKEFAEQTAKIDSSSDPNVVPEGLKSDSESAGVSDVSDDIKSRAPVYEKRFTRSGREVKLPFKFF